MAKFCASCGKALTDDVEFCPDCGGLATEDGAALFTRMTAETEGWKTPEEKVKKERPKRTKSQKQLMAYIAGAAAVVVLAVCLILYIQPSNRVIRAIRGGDYDRALELYWGNTSLAAGSQDASILPVAKRSAEQIVDAFSKHGLTADEAAEALGKLGALGEDAGTLLEENFEAFRTFNLSQEHFANAEQLSLNGDYLAAREEYLLVVENDSAYAEAQELAAESLDRYADSVIADADVYIQSRDYGAAIQTMTDGERVLLDFDVYNEKLDYKLNATYALYETATLEAAAALAEQEDYTAAAAALRTAMERFDYHTDALDNKLNDYLDLARDKEMSGAVDQANNLYDEGLYAEAFALLESMKAESGAKENPELDDALAAMERRFAADQIAAAEQTFAGNRANLPDAVSALRAALRIRPLDAIQARLDELSEWMPVSLAEMEYVDKQGTIFRSASTFEGLDGVNYDDGWVWGEDGAELTFVLNGTYDKLEGTMAVRRDDTVKASGHFEVLCDGESAFTSDTLTHPGKESVPISVDISGCQRLTLRFSNDYSVRTADNGYCYHGFCGPTVTKYLEGEETGETEETEETAETGAETEQG